MKKSAIIASEAVYTLAGEQMLIRTIGAHDFKFDSEGTASFHFNNCNHANFAQIKTNADGSYDLNIYYYDADFKEYRPADFMTGLQGSDLQGAFEQFTGLFITI